MSATLNGLDVISARLLIPWRGAWVADLDLNPEIAAAMPTSGPATLVLGTPPDRVTTLLGTIDPRFSGIFVATGKVRIVGGAGGWDKTIPSQHFASPAGALTSTQILQATAALVQELVVDLAPTPWGTDYVRSAGPASRVFGDADWYVDLTTPTTFVGPRKPALPDPSLEVLAYDPGRAFAEVACDVVIVPGTTIVDPRIGTTPIVVRDVEQTFTAAGSRAMLWCGKTAATQLAGLLRAAVREFGGIEGLKLRRYRYAAPGAGANTLQLQAVARDGKGLASPAPDLVPLVEWAGMAGLSAKLPPSLDVIVALVDGDPKQPVIVGYSTAKLPLELTLDASAATHLGPSSVAVDLAGGGAAVGRVGDEVTITIDSAAAGGLTAPSGGGPCTLTAGPIAVKGKITKGSLKVTSG